MGAGGRRISSLRADGAKLARIYLKNKNINKRVGE
jgi:hypothetical protein